MRPSTLLEVSKRVEKGADPVKEFQDFLDFFYDRATVFQMGTCLEDRPVILGSKKLNALYAASAEYLSKRYQLRKIPSWTSESCRYLDKAWFVSPDENMREYLVFSSPAEFRSRNIFTEAAPLRRARTWQAEQRLIGRMNDPAEQERELFKLGNR